MYVCSLYLSVYIVTRIHIGVSNFQGDNNSCLDHTAMTDNSSFGIRFYFHLSLFTAQFMKISCLAYSKTLKMEAALPSEKSNGSLRSKLNCIIEDLTLHSHRYENLKSFTVYIFVLLYSLLNSFQISLI
jgi:hypothetical protein